MEYPYSLARALAAFIYKQWKQSKAEIKKTLSYKIAAVQPRKIGSHQNMIEKLLNGA